MSTNTETLSPREIADARWTNALRELNTRDLPRQTVAMIASDFCSYGRDFDNLDDFIAVYYPDRAS